MSFYTIQTPGNRNEEVKKYIELKNYLKARDSAEQMGELTRMDELAKFFKPVSQPIGKLTEKVETLPTTISQAFPSLPGAPVVSAIVPAIKGREKMEVAGDPELTGFMENLLTNKLKDLIRYKDGNLKIGDTDLKITKNKIIDAKGNEYNRTPELLDFIFSDYPTEKSKEDKQALNDYIKILTSAGTLTPKEKKGPPAQLTKSQKWKEFLKPIYEKNKKGKGLQGGDWWSKWHGYQVDGLGQKGGNNKTVFLSSDPETLADRLTLLCGSAKAGNTGLRNEMVEICKELVRMKIMTQKQKQKILKDVKT